MNTIIALDIEASGIARDSYPIEVGIVMEDGQSYCSLIQPPPHWTHWSKEAEDVHGITQAELAEHGKSPLIVASTLNQWLQGTNAYTDCWVLDHPWLIKLYQQASIEPTFQLRDIIYVLCEHSYDKLLERKLEIAKTLKIERHRASNDARILQLAYESLKVSPRSKSKKLLWIEEYLVRHHKKLNRPKWLPQDK